MKPQINWYNQRNDCLSLGFMEGFFKGEKREEKIEMFLRDVFIVPFPVTYFPSTIPPQVQDPKQPTAFGSRICAVI